MVKLARVFALEIAFCCLVPVCSTQVDHDYSGSHPPSAVPPELRVDLNHATLGELLKVPGMKRTWASRILRFRPYRTKQDLLDEGVLPAELYSRVRDYVIAHKEKQ